MSTRLADGALKSLMLRLPIVTGWSAARRRGINGTTIFCFHGVTADAASAEEGERSLHIPVREFAEYVRWIASAYTVIALSEAVARLAARRALHGTACLTFDDAYQGVLEHALPVARAHGLPVTIFAVTEASRGRTGFWWDAIARQGALGEDERERCLTDLAGDADRILKAHPAVGAAPSDVLRAAGWPALRAAAGDLVAIQMHTRRHRNLSVLSADDRRDELSPAAFEAEMGERPSIVSYPYGRFDDAVTREAAHLGYTAGLSMEFGVARQGGNLLALPRVNVPAGISMDALECRAAGLRPRAG